MWNFEPTYFTCSDSGILTRPEFWPSVTNINSIRVISKWMKHKIKQNNINITKEHEKYLDDSYIVKSINKPTGISPRLKSVDDISFDLEKGTYVCGTVVLDISIPLAVYLGCSDIYLIGCDCNAEGHFYNVDHGSNMGIRDRSVKNQYRLFGKKCENDNINLINLTNVKGSCIGIKKGSIDGL